MTDILAPIFLPELPIRLLSRRFAFSAFSRGNLRFLNLFRISDFGFRILFFLLLPSALSTAWAAQSQWVSSTPDGKLTRKALPTGDRIMDFSFAGYMGGGVALPSVPAKVTVAPTGSDDTAVIQQAIDEVSKLELVGGFRGAVMLKTGAYQCNRTIAIRASGVVVRGSGSGPNGTVIKLEGEPHVGFSISGSGLTKRIGAPIRITDAYVPSGATSFNLETAAELKPGDIFLINRPVTAAWVKFMGMDTLVRSGKKETWLSTSGELISERTIKTISGTRVTLDIPLSDSLDSKYLNPPGATLVKCELAGRISQSGIENLRLVAPPQSVEISERHYQALRMNGVTDAWLRDLAIEDTVNSVGVGGGAKRITIEQVSIKHSVPTKGAAKPADFSAGGSQLLFDRCSGTGDNLFHFVTGARVTGPNVLLNCVFHGNGHIQPHARWATGLLVDRCEVPESGIDFMNRGEMGSGHGWTIGWSVAWNCSAKSFVIQQPPGTANWAIGCQGTREQLGMPFGHEPKLPEGTFDSHGTPVLPSSLYLAQLRDRLGPAALKAIGY
jgi:hypothetical protein